MMQSRAKENEIEITYEMEITKDYILVDNLRLNQVLINLLSNAIKFSPNGGQIKLSVKEKRADDSFSIYHFSIADQGIGMNEEQLGRLFKSFEQADMSISKRFGGTGLGLSISKSIIEMMNGRIWAQSEVDRGSTFFFTIRLKTVEKNNTDDITIKEISNATEDIIAETSVDLSKLRALLVDDVEINRIIVTDMLAETGIKIEEATNGIEAVNCFTNSTPGYYDIILMDMQMPEMDGCEASSTIRAIERSDAKSIAIVAMTANVMKADVERALNSGMNGHIAKPIDFQSAIQTIHRLCLEE
jgi:CheY-like chemotaxis protein